MADKPKPPRWGTTIRSLRLSDADWAELERIARRRRCLGPAGIPSRAAAVAWMIERERREQDTEGETR